MTTPCLVRSVTSVSKTWRWPLALAAVVFVAVAALSRGTSHPQARVADTVRDIRPPDGTKIGVIVSGSGAGNAVLPWASGATVAQFVLNGRKPGKSPVEVVVQDDGSDANQAVAAVQRLAAQHVSGIVYASLGDQMLPAVKAAADAGIAVLVPYSSDERLVDAGATTFLTGPGDSQVAAQLAGYAKKRGFAKVGLMFDNSPAGQLAQGLLAKAGLQVGNAVSVDPGSGDLKDAVVKAGGADDDAIVVWGTADEAARATIGAVEARVNPQWLLSSRVATPAFGKAQAQLLSPAVTDGVVSAGPWAGPWTPTAAIDKFYDDRQLAGQAGSSVDVSNADVRSFDAAVSIAYAAASARVTDAAAVLSALRKSQPPVSGAPLSFATAHALTDGNVALLTYTTVDDGSCRFPDPKDNGGHWIAVDGTYTLPANLRGLEQSFGG